MTEEKIEIGDYVTTGTRKLRVLGRLDDGQLWCEDENGRNLYYRDHQVKKIPPPRGKGAPRKRKNSIAERFLMLNRFVDVTQSEITSKEFHVWICLYRDARDGIAECSQIYLAQRIGCDKKTVSRAISRLKKRGLLDVVRKGRYRKGVSIYRLMALIDY